MLPAFLTRRLKTSVSTVLLLSGICSSEPLAAGQSLSPPLLERAIAVSKSLETGNPRPIASYIDRKQYIQHNLQIADGHNAIAAVARSLHLSTTRVNPIRAFQDGDYTFVQNDYFLAPFGGPLIGWEVLRWKNGRAVEHWDNLQPKPAAANRSGHTMIDGDTTTADLGKTTENKRLVENFEHDILIDGSRKRLPLYFDRNRLIQHDPLMRDNVTGFTDTLDKWAKDGTPMTYTNIHKVLGDGNFVLSLSEGMPLGKHVAFFDLFRIEKGKLAEHWDVMQDIPQRTVWNNDNGKF